MTGVKISALPAALAANDSDQLEVNQSGTSRRLTLGQIVGTLVASQRTATITYYVATTGTDSNDGSAGAPVQTFQKALDLCAATAVYSSGPFRIEIAAGTYTVLTALSFSPWLFNSGSSVTFAGINTGSTPSVIIQGSSDGTRTHDFINVAGYGMLFVFYDIYFRSFYRAVTSTQFGRVSLSRCWAKNCVYVMTCANGGYASAFGGDWDGRDLANVMVTEATGFGAAIVSPFNLTQTDYTAGLLIHHWETGVGISEACSGHMNFLRLEDCTTGIVLMRGASACNMTDTRFWRCGTGVLSRSVNDLLINGNQDFGQGTANACTTNVICTAAHMLEQETSSTFSSRQEFLAFSVTTSSNLTGSVAERPVFDPLVNIVRGRTRGRDTFDLLLYVRGATTTASGTLRLYFGATLVKAWTLPLAGLLEARIEILLEALNGTDWRGQISQMAGASATPVPSLIDIPDLVGLTSLTAETPVKLTWQAGAVGEFFQVKVCRLYSSIAGLTFP